MAVVAEMYEERYVITPAQMPAPMAKTLRHVCE